MLCPSKPPFIWDFPYKFFIYSYNFPTMPSHQTSEDALTHARCLVPSARRSAAAPAGEAWVAPSWLVTG